MSKRLTDRELLLSKLNYLGDQEIEAVLDFVSQYEASVQDQAPPEITREITDDDLIAALSSARENRRAREVFEWEAVRRRAEARASQLSSTRH
ncbi:MAG TPA: hypothetical protein VJ302_36800 [Blastocatellia bacterium]|nr:hypothetical protein [Blastocatellia bacterium]